MSISVMWLSVLCSVTADTVKRDDVRQEFIVEKYIAMKYTSPEMKVKILEESGYILDTSPVSLSPCHTPSLFPPPTPVQDSRPELRV